MYLRIERRVDLGEILFLDNRKLHRVEQDWIQLPRYFYFLV